MYKFGVPLSMLEKSVLPGLGGYASFILSANVGVYVIKVTIHDFAAVTLDIVIVLPEILPPQVLLEHLYPLFGLIVNVVLEPCDTVLDDGLTVPYVVLLLDTLTVYVFKGIVTVQVVLFVTFAAVRVLPLILHPVPVTVAPLKL